jgi:hypothetical protein
MTKKATLQKRLDILIADAEEQTQWYQKSQERLYRTLANVYLWWRDVLTQRFLHRLGC